MPFFIFGTEIFGRWVVVEPFFDANPAAMHSVITRNGFGWLIGRLKDSLFRFLRRFRAKSFFSTLPERWLLKQSPERIKGFINLAPDAGSNTQDL